MLLRSLQLAVILVLTHGALADAFHGPLNSPAIRTALRTTTPQTQASDPGSVGAWDSANKSASVALSGGDLVATASGADFESKGVRSVTANSSGKKCFAVVATAIQGQPGLFGIGVGTSAFVFDNPGSPPEYLGGLTNGTGLWGDGNLLWNNGVLDTFDSIEEGERVLVCVDFDSDSGNGYAWWKVGTGNWNADAGADPTAPSGGTSLIGIPGTLYAIIEIERAGQVMTGEFTSVAGMPSGYSDWN